jgi:hypothetical protein
MTIKNIIRIIISWMIYKKLVACMGETNAYKILVIKPEGNIPFGRSRHK